MHTFGFVRVGAAVPRLKVADIDYNLQQIIQLIQAADQNNLAVLAFPELCLTGYTCGDLFLQGLLQDKARQALLALAQATRTNEVVVVVGLPLVIKHRLFNCAAVLQRGEILGIVPKIYLANQKEFYEKRWFSSGQELIRELSNVELTPGYPVPFGQLLFHSPQLGYTLGVEICEDLWAVIPPSSFLAVQGANLLINLSASNELVAKADYRRELIQQQSARCLAGYLYVSAGVHESTTDTVFGGDCLLAENGVILASAPRFQRDNLLLWSEIDVERLNLERLANKTFADSCQLVTPPVPARQVEIQYYRDYDYTSQPLRRHISPHPFIPQDSGARDRRCQEIFQIQVAGLARRLEHTGAKTAVLGISGGLDSTLALLVTCQAFDLLGYPREQVLAVTMPGFGTTDTTYTNALQLMQALAVTCKEIDIKPACLQHFQDIGHDPARHDITYENVQARERTQILMDLANQHGGLVVGTGDLSELALGWATYNGDHMSHYAVNAGVPKTLVKYLVEWVAEHAADPATAACLHRILATPISPELLPPDASGNIQQKTEDIVGPYELHDFFLYYLVRFNLPPRKIAFLADQAFTGRYAGDEIRKWLKVFYRRFFSQQFKRSCLPDGPKVGSVSLSPRADWRMPSDAQVNLWLKELENF
ncbi:NAD(+) synthase [Carboxydocella sp. JDF658]|uniref:NAD(+) synthase n=1 Tax=Carboxydocella sp. JDF658 TaxID=1926600 RepID=UPI0009AD935C|nr:NAD(+) synthase [Carboxydocella sp. JDF658]